MLKPNLIYLAVLISLNLTACGGSGSSGGVRLDARDSGSTQIVQPGDTVELELEANPSTGFSWELAEYDQNVLLLQGAPQFRAETDLPGSPTRETWVFAVQGAGETRLLLRYTRPWEDVPPAQVFEVRVVSQY